MLGGAEHRSGAHSSMRERGAEAATTQMRCMGAEDASAIASVACKLGHAVARAAGHCLQPRHGLAVRHAGWTDHPEHSFEPVAGTVGCQHLGTALLLDRCVLRLE